MSRMRGSSLAHVSFRPLCEDDLELRVAWINDPLVNRYLSYDLPVTLGSTMSWFGRVKTAADRREYIVVDELLGRPIGCAGFLHISDRQAKAEHHLFIGEASARGRGFGKAAYRELARIAFEELRLQRLYGYQHVDNTVAHELVASLGWAREGRLRLDGWYHGHATDRYIIGLLLEEWQQRPSDSHGMP